MSFKYRFILSFVLIEIFFIVLIVSINFITISNSSKNLIDEKIETNTIFLEQLVKVPISVYDTAALDDLVHISTKYTNSIVILDSKNRVLSENYSYRYLTLDNLLKIKNSISVDLNNETYEIVYKKIYEDSIYLGSMYIIYDTSSNHQFISNNKSRTLVIIMIEILLSTLLAYIIGTNLTKKLAKLSDVALKFGKEMKIEVPYTDSKDEIGILSKSMSNMQDNLISRNKELKNYNKLLRKQKYELIQANKAKDDFLANMSHELKTPLNSINVISDVMIRNRTKNLDDKQIKNLGIINKCGRDLLFLINDILDLSKLEAGQIILNNDNINIKEFINGIYDMFYLQTKEKEVDFVLKVDDSLTFMYSDEDRIKQIIKNLLSNALKFTHNGKIFFIVEDLGKDISIKIKDQGIGIPLDKLEHIFDRFKQVDGSTTRKYGGTGLGLSICKELAHLLRGDITVLSQVNVGSEFKLVIPKNEDLIKSLDILDLKRGNNPSISSLPETNNEIKKDSIYVLNSEPVLFFQIIHNLKKEYEVIQISKLSQIDKNRSDKLINLNSILNSEDINFILENEIKLVLLMDKEEIDDRLSSNIIAKISSPFSNIDLNLILNA